ncbi:MAG: hypothetical protein GDA56_10400 [Hormoscilla sp. GM7CHS1pb]|nr:hypothetical protein [Hormoscilla sp. GM7CHS1pb]
MIARDKVRKISSYTHLELTAEEEENYSLQLSKIFNWLDKINEVDTNNVLPTKNPDDSSNMIQIDDLSI